MKGSEWSPLLVCPNYFSGGLRGEDTMFTMFNENIINLICFSYASRKYKMQVSNVNKFNTVPKPSLRLDLIDPRSSIYLKG